MRVISFTTFILMTFAFFSCQKEPEAGFTVNKNSVMPGEEVIFTNTSVNGVNYYWDFADGNFSDLENPVHVYKKSGSYRVSLKAFSKNEKKENIFYKTVTVKSGNAINYGDNTYPLDKAYIMKVYDDGNIAGYRLFMTSSGITYSDDNVFTGKGDMLSMVIYTPNKTGLPTGTYIQNDSGPFLPETFPVAIIELGVDLDLIADPEILLKTTSGSIVISKFGSEHTITADLSYGSSKVDAYYRGYVKDISYYKKTLINLGLN